MQKGCSCSPVIARHKVTLSPLAEHRGGGAVRGSGWQQLVPDCVAPHVVSFRCFCTFEVVLVGWVSQLGLR